MADHSLRRRSVRIVAGALGAGVILVTAPVTVLARLQAPVQAPAAVVPLEVVPTTPGGGVSRSEAPGTDPTVSGDGRFVAYEGLVAAGDDGTLRRTVFVADRQDGSNVELSVLPPERRTGATIMPVVSGDGCTVTVLSEIAFDVFRDDDDGTRWDVYRTTLPHCAGATGEWELVSTRAGATATARNDVVTDPPAVSRSGTIVAYTHPADNLVDAEGLTTISVVDLEVPVDAPERTQLASGLPVAAPADLYVQAGLDQPALSLDGRYLAFRSDATSADAVPQWAGGPVEGGPATRQVFVWDRQQGDPFEAVKAVSSRPDGAPAEAGAARPVVSRDGRFVAFESADSGLVDAAYPACGADCPTQVYLLDRDPDGDGVFDDPADGGRRLQLVSRDPSTAGVVAGTAASTAPSLSADGQQVAFTSIAPNLSATPLAGGGAAGDGAVFVADTALGTLERVSDVVDPEHPGLATYARPMISETSRALVFDAVADPVVVPAGVDGARQVIAVTRPPKLWLPDTDVGTTRIGLASDEWYVAVVNDGPSGFRPATVTVDDPHFVVDQERSTCTLGTVVPPGGDCTIRISFTPTADGEVSGVLTVAEEGFGAVSVSARLTGTGGEPALRAEPAGTDFGEVVVGAPSREFHFDILNVSALATSIASVDVTGGNAGDFAVTTNNCAGRPLNPGVTCNVGLTFTPTDAGRRTALVEVYTPEGQYTSAVIAGDGVYRPRVAFLDTTVLAGRDILAFGQGYPADSDVTVVFDDGGDVVVHTNERGEFIARVPVPDTAGGGTRALVVEAAGGVAASAPIDIVEEPQQMVGMPGFGLGSGRGR